MEYEREDIIVNVIDLRISKMCKKGTEIFFRKHNLDFRDFCLNGISAKKLSLTKDAMAQKVVEAAYGRRR